MQILNSDQPFIKWYPYKFLLQHATIPYEQDKNYYFLFWQNVEVELDNKLKFQFQSIQIHTKKRLSLSLHTAPNVNSIK